MKRTTKYLYFAIIICIGSLFFSCKNDTQVSTDATKDGTANHAPIKVPIFSRDTAFALVAKQVAFGPRIPGTDAHQATRKWLVQKLKSYGASVNEQSFKANTVPLGEVRSVNIIGSFNPTYARRVILAAHWDTRYTADEDDERATEKFDGADDGGSGVAILLELARLIKDNPVSLGVDIIFFDAEDQGASDGKEDTWCLGSQYWSLHPHVKGYRAEYGILLDMVGAKGATFLKEDLTNVFVPEKVRKIHSIYDRLWAQAKGMGQSAYFLDIKGKPLIDDHYYVNLNTGIPMADVINKSVDSAKGFGKHWHTHDDNMSIIDPKTLGAVGQVVTAFLYNSSRAPL
ncbi:MAG TPA: M28 family peptidase [Saprospiraceae bacterium]|nr:M28 family peptidase [Saprospiraceae bacterium]